MRKRRIGIHLEEVGMGIILIAFILMVYFSEDNLTFAFLGIMGAVILCAYIIGLRTIGMIRSELEDKADELRYISKKYEQTPWEKLREDKTLFREKHLRRLFGTFMTEMERMPEGIEGSYRYDIADYINEENLDSEVNARLLNQIPDVLTGLGILGTFIGLIIGLRDFDTSTNETMLASIPPLVDGIKVAFHTSIYGIAFSLMYSMLQKFCLTRLSTSVDHFVHSFYQNVMPVPENDAFNLLLKYQRVMSESMEEFTEVLASKMADSFRKITTPTFEKMINSMDEITDEMTKTQTEGMGRVVDSFIDEMNRSLNGQFREVARTSRNLCNWQKNMMTDVSNTLTEIRQSGLNIAKVNQDTSQIIKNIDTFTEKLNQYNLVVNDVYQSMTRQGSNFNKISEEQRHTLDLIKEHEEQLIHALDELKESGTVQVASTEEKSKKRHFFRGKSR